MKSQREREGKRAYESKDAARGRGEKKMRERKEREEWKGGTEGGITLLERGKTNNYTCTIKTCISHLAFHISYSVAFPQNQ